MHALLAAVWLLPARMRSSWRMLLVAAAGVVGASTLLAAAPIYSAAMSDLGVQFRLGREIGDNRLQSATLEGLLVSPQALAQREAVDRIIEARLGWLADGTFAADRSERLTLQVGASRAGAPAGWATFVHAVAHLESHVTVVEGRLPNSEASQPEVALLDGFQRHVALGSALSVQGGGFDDCQRRPTSEDPEEARAEVQCRPTTRISQAFTAVVVGFVRPRNPTAPVWGLYAGSLEVPDAPLYATGTGISDRDRARATAGVGSLPLFVPAEGARAGIVEAAPLLVWRHRVGFEVAPSSIRRGDSARALREVAALQTDVKDRLGLNASYNLPIAPALEIFTGSRSLNQVPLLIILLQVTGIVLYYVVIVSQMLIERETEELGVLASRGASAGQVALVHLLEAAVLAVPAAILAPSLAVAGVRLLGRTPTFEGITGGGLLPASATPLAYLLAAGGALLAMAAMVLPIVVARRRTILDAKADQARPASRSALQRYYLDLAMVGLAALLLWELRRRGTVFASDDAGGWSSDPLLLASPFVFALAAAALVLRLYPPLVRAVVSAALLAGGTAIAIGLRRAARSPATYSRLLLLLVLSLAVGTFAASYSPTVQTSREDRARYEAGADVRLTIGGARPIDADGAAEAIRSIEGVADDALATRALFTTSEGVSLEALGVDADRVASVAWFRNDFADEPLSTLARRLQSTVPPGGGIELPPNARDIEAAVFGNTARANSVIWARLRDAAGRYANIDLGGAEQEGWRVISGSVPENLTAPVYFSGLLITDARGVGVQRQGSLFFDDIAVVNTDGTRVLLDDFEGRFGWLHFGNARTVERFERSEERARSGRAAMRWQWAPGTPDGRRMLAMNAGNVPLAAIVSESALWALGVQVGGVATVSLDGVRVPIAVRGVARLFPTLSADPGFVVVNRRDLEALATLLETPTARSANELWLHLGPDFGSVARPTTIEAVRNRLGAGAAAGRLFDVAAEIEEVRADPTLQASGSGILGAAFVAVLSLSILGFLVSVTTGARAREVELAVLRAVGSSRIELLRALLLEWGTVLALGLVVGVLLGRRIAGVMLSFLDVTESGTRTVPPFVVETDWTVVATGGFVLTAVLGIGLLVTWRSSMRHANAAQLRLTR